MFWNSIDERESDILCRVFQIKWLPEALDTPYVWSNYHASYAPKGRKIIDAFNKGNAVFTFPKPPLKCPGAPQKIMYIAERLLTEVFTLSQTCVCLRARDFVYTNVSAINFVNSFSARKAWSSKCPVSYISSGIIWSEEICWCIVGGCQRKKHQC